MDREPFMAAMMRNRDVPEDVDELSRAVVGCAIEVHRHLGPGLLERIYEDALVYELGHRGIAAERQAEIAIVYKDAILRGQRLDLIAGNQIIIEIKSVATLQEIHTAQLLSYLRAADKPLGLLLNFNVPRLSEGIRRVFNERWTNRSMNPSTPSPASLTAPPPSSSSRPSR